MKTLKILAFLCFVLGFTASTGQSMGLVKKDKPFKATIKYSFAYNVSPHVDAFYGIGKATHTGKVTSEFNVNKSEEYGYSYGGDAVLTAADGSELQVEMTVHVSPTEANGTWVFHGGTGRFADVDGEGTYHVSIISDTEFILTLDGTINY